MTTAEAKSKSIDGRSRSVRELLDKPKHAIDFYQREYQWQEWQVRELIDDLTGKFLVYRLRVLGQWFDGIRFYAAASSPRRSRRTWAGLR